MSDTASPRPGQNDLDRLINATFPGAVVDGGGGTVSGRTVTWDDADVLADGVSASGYATPDEGVSTLDRFGPWIITGIVVAGIAVGAAAIMRRRRSTARADSGARRSGQTPSGRKGSATR